MATTTAAIALSSQPYLVTTVQVSSITAGEDLNLSHGGPSGVRPSFVLWELVERPTSRHAVCVEVDRDNDNTTNNTARVAIDTEVGGDLAGAVVRFIFFFLSQATGGTT
jgi:hypothetical protein